MADDILLSLVVPTRGRTDQLSTFLHSLVDTTSALWQLEVILVIDNDDASTLRFTFPDLRLVRVVVEPGRTMGSLNMAGYEASCGRYIMLLNDDVIVRTRGWDRLILNVLRRFSDDLALIHVNDLVFQDKLCTFPLVSRQFCELAGGICPSEYKRYRIDDHIEDIFTLLWHLGEKRIVYLPEVVFEHGNYVEHTPGLRQYFSDDAILTQADAPTFTRLVEKRKAIAIRLKQRIDGHDAEYEAYDRMLASVKQTADLRPPERLNVWRTSSGRIRIALQAIQRFAHRVWNCFRNRGTAGLARAIWRRLRPNRELTV